MLVTVLMGMFGAVRVIRAVIVLVTVASLSWPSRGLCGAATRQEIVSDWQRGQPDGILTELLHPRHRPHFHCRYYSRWPHLHLVLRRIGSSASPFPCHL